MKRKIKLFFVKLQMKILYAWKVFHYPKDTVLTHYNEQEEEWMQVSKWQFIRLGWEMLDDIVK